MGALRGHPLILEGRFSMERRSPKNTGRRIYSRTTMCVRSSRKENETRFEVKWKFRLRFRSRAWFGFVDIKSIYDAQSHIAQSYANVSLTSVLAPQGFFRLGGLHLDHRALLQWSTNQEVVPVPLLSASLSNYYEFWSCATYCVCKSLAAGTIRSYTRAVQSGLSALTPAVKSRWGTILRGFIRDAKWKRMRNS